MEDYKELIERLYQHHTTLAEANAKLRAELEREKEYTAAYQGMVDKYEKEIVPGLLEELEQVTAQRDAYKGTLDSANQTCAAMAKKLEQMAQERDAAVEDIEEILRLEHDTDICRYCNRIKHCADYGCEESARWRGTQKEE